MNGAGVAQNLDAVRARIAAACARAGRDPLSVTLVAVSKTHSASAVRTAHAAGQRAFGENRVQELRGKAAELQDVGGLQWHLIGSLQTNKVPELLAVPGLALVHSLDRQRLADELQRELARSRRELPVLLQVNATGEQSKHGCAPQLAASLLAHVRRHCANVSVQGLMAMGPLDGDAAPVFARIAALCGELRAASGLPLPVLSLGMSHDLEAAIASGATMVRIGTAVFGARDSSQRG